MAVFAWKKMGIIFVMKTKKYNEFNTDLKTKLDNLAPIQCHIYIDK